MEAFDLMVAAGLAGAEQSSLRDVLTVRRHGAAVMAALLAYVALRSPQGIAALRPDAGTDPAAGSTEHAAAR
ncbi:hypothetical protein [Kitasatospora cineracea]|uniref:hypothetical protein n=1 Tax=Kitasatospora cineracea TaxID=88074 RepID=UPI0037ABD2CC